MNDKEKLTQSNINWLRTIYSRPTPNRYRIKAKN